MVTGFISMWMTYTQFGSSLVNYISMSSHLIREVHVDSMLAPRLQHWRSIGTTFPVGYRIVYRASTRNSLTIFILQIVWSAFQKPVTFFGSLQPDSTQILYGAELIELPLNLVLLNCFNCIFRHLKLELLMQFPASNDEKYYYLWKTDMSKIKFGSTKHLLKTILSKLSDICIDLKQF